MHVSPSVRVYPGVNLDEAKDQVRAALRRLFRECGGQANFTNRLNERLAREGHRTITKQAVAWWVSEGSFLDQRYWPHIEELSDLAATRRHLRPDLYGLGAP